MTNLVGLYLNQNGLSGTIPAELGNLTSLQALYLWGNGLSGTIPAELESLTNLQRLYLYDNSINWPRTLMNVSSTRQLPPTSRSPWFVPPGVRPPVSRMKFRGPSMELVK